MSYLKWIATALAVTLVATLALAACGEDETTSDGASSEESEPLTVYSGRDEELVAPIIEQYEQASGTEVEVRYGDTAELAATVLEEGDASPADAFFGQDAGALGALGAEGRLIELDEELLERVDERFRSVEGEWVGVSGRARIVAYNSEAIEESELPDSILDFTGEEWDGRIGWAPTNSSFQAFVTALRVLEGEETAESWLDGIVANDPIAYEDNTATRDGVASGEVDVGFVNHYYVAEARAAEGEDYPVEIYQPPGGDPGSLVNVAGVGVLASSENQEGAVEFAEFLLEPEAQQFFADETFEYPLIEGVEADPAVVPLEEIEQPEIDLSALEDLEATLEMIQESGAL